MRIKCDKYGQELRVTIQGELDHHTAPKIRQQLDKSLKDPGINRLILDLKELSLMDSSGIGLIIGRYKVLNARGGTVAVLHPNRSIDRILSMAGLYKLVQKIG